MYYAIDVRFYTGLQQMVTFLSVILTSKKSDARKKSFIQVFICYLLTGNISENTIADPEEVMWIDFYLKSPDSCAYVYMVKETGEFIYI